MKISLKKQVQSTKVKQITSLTSSVLVDKSPVYIPKVKSEERANAIFSLLLLLEHRDHWNWKEGYTVDWEDSNTIKWCITFINDKPNLINTNRIKKLLSFGSKESSEQFLETFNQLIYSAKDLL